jgi:hypothetical protein
MLPEKGDVSKVNIYLFIYLFIMGDDPVASTELYAQSLKVINVLRTGGVAQEHLLSKCKVLNLNPSSPHPKKKEDGEFKASLHYKERSCLKKQNKETN